MKKLVFAIYGNGGDINNVKKSINEKTIVTFPTLSELINHCVKGSIYITYSNIDLIPYAYDDRISKYVMMLVGDYGGHKAQFMSYVIILER